MNIAPKLEVPALVLNMTGITKRFPGVVALNDVSLTLQKGEVLALVGENGAGKSTLMKILSGAYLADEGEMRLFGTKINYASPLLMMRAGVAVIYQELLLAKDLTVAENMYLGRLPRTRFGTVDWGRMRADAQSILDLLGFDIDPNDRVGDLSVAHRQIVEIAKALSQNARIIVLDEPSAVLGASELTKLFKVITKLSQEGVSFIYISHRLEEVFEISDRTVVLRDGQLVGAHPTSELDKNMLVSMMVGRELSNIYPPRHAKPGETLLMIEGLSNSVLKDISLFVRSGEILGICGLAGAGRTEVLRALCGADHATATSFEMAKLDKLPSSPKLALEHGIGLLPEDRRHQGLFIDQDVRFNINMANLAPIKRAGFLSPQREKEVAGAYIKRLRVKTPNTKETIANLSGGNQQKCVLAKLLNANCRVLLVDEPTRGVDIGAKREIYEVLTELADNEGIAIIMVSSELPEIIGLCDRTYVMRDGRITGEFTSAEISEEKIMHVATD